MDYSIYQYTAPFNQLFLGLLASFLVRQLWKSSGSSLVRILAILLSLSAVGCFIHGFVGLIGIITGTMHDGGMSPRRLVGTLGLWLSPFTNVLLLSSLTVLVCRYHRNRENDDGVLTHEERYGTGRVQTPSRPD